MRPSGRPTQFPAGSGTHAPYSHNNPRMTSSSRYHPYATGVGRGNAQHSGGVGEGFLQSQAYPQNGAPQYTNMQGRSAPINYQCSQPGPSISRFAGQQTHGMPVGNNYTVMGRNISTTSAAMQQSNVGLPQGRAFPSQQMAWQTQPPQNQMMPCAGGDVHLPGGQVASPNQQDKVKMKGAPLPARSPGLRVLTGRVGKVKEWAGLALPCPVLFKVHGTLGTEIESSGGAAKLSSRSKNFELTGEDGQHLSCTFLEIDREVPNVRKGERVVIMGKAKKDGSLQVVTIEEEKGDASTCLARLENFAVRGIRLAMRQKQDEAAAAV